MPDDIRLPIIEEEAHVTKRAADVEHVTVRTVPEQEQVVVRDEIWREHVEIRRVAVEREVDRAPAVREENGVTIIPVIEERLVVEKRLFLVEEVHVFRSAQAEAVELPTTLRRTRIEVDRTDLTKTQEDVHGRT